MSVMNPVAANAPPMPKAADVERRLAQQAEKPLDMSRFAFHSLAAATMIGSYGALRHVMDKLPMDELYGGDLTYLTILGMIASVVVMVLGALNDLMRGDVVIISLKRLFLMIALPVELIVSVVYWPLVIFAPHLMLPPKPDATGSEVALLYIPLWIDIGLHLVPAVALLIDFFKYEGRYEPPASDRFAAVLSVMVTTLYAVWIEFCAAWNGRFPYPFLDMVDTDIRLYIYLAAATFAFATFFTLNALHK